MTSILTGDHFLYRLQGFMKRIMVNLSKSISNIGSNAGISKIVAKINLLDRHTWTQ